MYRQAAIIRESCAGVDDAADEGIDFDDEVRARGMQGVASCDTAPRAFLSNAYLSYQPLFSRQGCKRRHSVGGRHGDHGDGYG